MSKQNNNEQPRSRTALIRSAMLAMLSLLLTVAVAASLTFALFVNEVEDNTLKIQAGDLNISALYVKLEGTMIDTDATSPTYGKLRPLTTAESTKNIPLTEETESIFNIQNAVPTLKQTATIEVMNEGNITFSYSIELTDLVKSTAEKDVALLSQILITMQSGNKKVEFLLKDYDKDTSKLSLGELAPGSEKATITITAEFLNDVEDSQTRNPLNTLVKDDNMDAIGGSASFDITIIAVQATA